MVEITVALISSAIAVLSSVIAEFIPAWDKWKYKRVTQVTISLLFPVVVWIIQCATALELPFVVACDFLGFIKLAGVGVSAVLAGAGAYHLAVRPRTERHEVEYKNKGSRCKDDCC